jgi:hypothetical protein
MVKIENKNFVKAVEEHPESKLRIAVLADSSRTTLDKVMNGEPDLLLSSVEKLADFLGFNVEVRFVKKQNVASQV